MGKTSANADTRLWLSVSIKSFVLCSVFAVFCCYLWNCGRLLLYLKSQSPINFWNLGPDILQYFSVHLWKYFNQAWLADFVWRCWFWERRKWRRRWLSRKPSEKKSSFSLVNDSGKKKRKTLNKKAKHKNEGIDWWKVNALFHWLKYIYIAEWKWS